MKKIFLAMAMALALSACGDDAPKNASEKPVIKIGVVLPLSGDSAFAGIPVQKTVVQALEDIESKNNLKYDYELFFEDNQNGQRLSIQAANTLLNVRHVKALLSIWSPAGLSLNKIVNDKKIIHIGCAWGYETAAGPFAFNHATFPEEQTSALLAQLKKRDIKSIGLVYENEQAQNELTEILLKKLKENNIEVAFDYAIMRGSTDHRVLIEKMKKSDAQIIAMFMLPPSMNTFVKQKNEAGYETPMTSIEFFTYQPELFEGYWYVSDALGTEEFGKYIKEKTGEDLSSCMGNLYDSVGLLVSAFENAPLAPGEDIPDNESVVEMLQNTDTAKYESVMGNISIDEDGNIHTETTLKVIENGVPVVVKE